MSARSGETEDNWLSDLAVGWAADFIKIGSKAPSPQKRNSAKSIRNGKNFIFNNVQNPILFLLFDLGANPVTAPTIQVSVSRERDPPVWAIHSRGHDERVFGCLKLMKCGEAAEKFFAASSYCLAL